MNRIERNELYKVILKDPINHGAEELCVLSGYATPKFVEEYLNSINKKGTNFRLKVIQGMARLQGMTRIDHERFMDLEKRSNFDFYYYTGDKKRKQTVHAKTYIWLKKDKPILAFMGSANFTNQGFKNEHNRIETMTQTDPDQAYTVFNNVLKESKSINHSKIKNYIKMVPHKNDPLKIEKIHQYLSISLLNESGQVNPQSGLNLGFVSTYPLSSRDIAAIPVATRNASFFPNTSVTFTVMTDDGRRFDMHRTKDAPGRLTLVKDLKRLGQYFRDRLGIPYGVPITREDLDKYGRSDVVFEKDESGMYSMDFLSSINDFENAWNQLFQSAGAGVETWSKNGKVRYKLGTREKDIVIAKLDATGLSGKGRYPKERARRLWLSEKLFEAGARRDPDNVTTIEVGNILGYKNGQNNSYWWVIYKELVRCSSES